MKVFANCFATDEVVISFVVVFCMLKIISMFVAINQLVTFELVSMDDILIYLLKL